MKTIHLYTQKINEFLIPRMVDIIRWHGLKTLFWMKNVSFPPKIAYFYEMWNVKCEMSRMGKFIETESRCGDLGGKENQEELRTMAFNIRLTMRIPSLLSRTWQPFSENICNAWPSRQNVPCCTEGILYSEKFETEEFIRGCTFLAGVAGCTQKKSCKVKPSCFSQGVRRNTEALIFKTLSKRFWGHNKIGRKSSETGSKQINVRTFWFHAISPIRRCIYSNGWMLIENSFWQSPYSTPGFALDVLPPLGF